MENVADFAANVTFSFGLHVPVTLNIVFFTEINRPNVMYKLHVYECPHIKHK